MSLDRKEFDKRFVQAMHIFGLEIQEKFKDKLSKEHGVDTADLKSSIRYEVKGNEVIFSMKEHGKYVEYGTPPHFPPPESLKGWVGRKFNISDDKEKDRVAWLVANAIAKRGTKPYPFIRMTMHQDLKNAIGESLEATFK